MDDLIGCLVFALQSMMLARSVFRSAALRSSLNRFHVVGQKASISSSSPLMNWDEKWTEATAGVRHDAPYEESGNKLRALMQTGLLRLTDIRDDPEKFFNAHRILARHATTQGPGFWIRFTVQHNLFAGTVVGLGNPEQIRMLDDFQQAGSLGCFALTEKLAGVNSGLVVNTTAEWNEEKQVFILNSATEGAEKNWISQGYTADKAVVLADLTVGGKVVGPHAFLMDMRVNGELAEGVVVGDMGQKSVGNDLDNAWIRYTNVELPKSALLNRYADVQGGEYSLTVPGVRPFDMIGQRLFTGRVAVAQASLEFTKGLYAMTKEYSDNKKCWAPGAEPVLSSIPQLAALYRHQQQRMDELTAFVGRCERELSAALRDDVLPSKDLVAAIAVAKVKSVESSIELCFALKQEVGSYALMAGTGFEQMDFLQCCKFAEGDSRILMQKMSRDLMRAHSKGKTDPRPEVEAMVSKLAGAVSASAVARGGDSAAKAAAWDDNFEMVYELAQVHMNSIMAAYKE